MTEEDKLSKLQHYSENFSRPDPLIRLTAKAFKAHRKELTATATALADKLYEMTNIARVIDPKAYEKEINDIVLPLHSEDNQFILQHAQSYFHDQYLDPIRKLGESPELLDQITKRTGKSSKEYFRKILVGFNSSQLALDAEKITSISNQEVIDNYVTELNSLEEHHISELCAEYDLLLAKNYAKVINDCLKCNPIDFLSLEAILSNKSEEDIQTIIGQFEERYILDEMTDPIKFWDYLKETVQPEDYNRLKIIFSGFNAEVLADKVHWVFKNIEDLYEELANLLSNPQAPFYHLRKFPFLKEKYQEYIARPFVNCLTLSLFPEQFTALNNILEEKYSYRLTSEFYLCNKPENIYKTFFQLEKSVSNLLTLGDLFQTYPLGLYKICLEKRLNDYDYTNKERYFIIKATLAPLINLSPNNLFTLNQIFECLLGISLKEYANKIVEKFYKKQPTSEINNLLNILLYGKTSASQSLYQKFSSLKDQLDSRADFSIRNEWADKWEEAIKQQTLDEQDFLKSLGKIKVKNFLEFALQLKDNLASDEILATLRKKLSPGTFIQFRFYLQTFNSKDFLQEAQENPRKLLQVAYETPLEVAALFKESGGTFESITANLADSEKLFVLILMNLPNASKFKKDLDLDKFLSKEADDFINQYNQHEDFLLNFEAAFDFLYDAWEFCLEPTFGTLRDSLYNEYLQGSLDKVTFGKLILLFENLPLDLIEHLQGLVKTGEKDLTALHELHKIFREYTEKLTLIQRIYFISDAEKSLRERIYDFNVLPRDENLTLLLLDAYDPENLAKLVTESIKSLKGEKLGQEIYDLLKPDSELIPKDVNWHGEMYHQVRIRFEEQTNEKLITKLRERQVPAEENGINTIAGWLYGIESKSCFDFYVLLQDLEKDDALAELRIRCKNLKPSQLEKVVDMFMSYFDIDFAQEISSKVAEDDTREEILDLIEQAKNWEKSRTDKE